MLLRIYYDILIIRISWLLRYNDHWLGIDGYYDYYWWVWYLHIMMIGNMYGRMLMEIDDLLMYEIVMVPCILWWICLANRCVSENGKKQYMVYLQICHALNCEIYEIILYLDVFPLNCQTNPSNVGKAIVNYPQFYRIRGVLSINPYEWFILSLRTVQVLSIPSISTYWR